LTAHVRAAEDVRPAAPAANPARTTLAESLGTIEPRDLLRVSIDSLRGPGETLTRLVRVDADGGVRLPYLKAQKVAGLNVTDAEAAILKAYREANILARGVGVVSVLRVEAGTRAKDKGGAVGKGDLVAVAVDELTGANSSTEF